MKKKHTTRRSFIFVALVISFSLISCPFSQFSNNSLQQGIGFTDSNGSVTFNDQRTKSTVPVIVLDSETQNPVPNIQVNYLSNGSRFLVTVYDKDGRYLPDLFEGPLKKQTTYLLPGMISAHAQAALGSVLFSLELRSNIQSISDIKSLFLQNRPQLESWNWAYHDECWTHAQLQQGLGLELTGVEMIFSGGDAFGNISDQLVEAMLLATGETINLNDQIFASLPDPVSIRIYHMPITIPAITIRVMGPCNMAETTPPVKGGFATLIAQSSPARISVSTQSPSTNTSILSSPTIIPGNVQSNGIKSNIGRILFVSSQDGYSNIYVMNADGSGQTKLTNNTDSSPFIVLPQWSPDGKHISYQYQNGKPVLYVMNSDGTGAIKLTDKFEYIGSWSPDGKHLVFSSLRDGNSEIYTIAADGTGLTRLTNNPGLDSPAGYSPDGQHIYFISDRDGNWDAYVMNADGTGVINLTNNPANENYMSVSPDGKRIAFDSDRDGNSDIYVMNADGSAQTRLTDNQTSYILPFWSPNGKQIGFISDTKTGGADIYVMNADGSGQTNLTNNANYENRGTSWTPNGAQIVYTAKDNLNDSGRYIYIINSDGSDATRLTINPIDPTGFDVMH